MVQVGQVAVGKGDQLVLIAGPCVVESEELTVRTAEAICRIAERAGVPYIFKSSYAKANRMSIESFTGLGIDEGLRILERVKEEVGVPVITDIHSAAEAERASQVVDAVQIPALLCKQTDIVLAAGRTGKPINIKKGQFLAPEDLVWIIRKVESTGNRQILLTERGSIFGYHNIVVDMRSLVLLRRVGYPVVFDATHSVQLPENNGFQSGGQPEFIRPLARAAVAVGIDAIFIETHPDPANALCDGACMLPLRELGETIKELVQLQAVVKHLSSTNSC
jgi:2-dehydro-3-deoxyphosphooctonate aldolase (KDO 8-P synthase)